MFDINICLTVYMHAHIAMHSEQPICQKMYRLKKKKKNRCGKVNFAIFCL